MKIIKVKCGPVRALLFWRNGKQLTLANKAARRMFG